MPIISEIPIYRLSIIFLRYIAHPYLHVPRSAMLSFASLNMDGSPPCLPPRPPPPPPPALQNSPTLKVWRLEARNPDVDVELNSYPFKLKILVAATLLMGRDWMKASGVDLDNPP